jgi:hypothetical protein
MNMTCNLVKLSKYGIDSFECFGFLHGAVEILNKTRGVHQ